MSCEVIHYVLSLTIGQLFEEVKLKYWDRCFKTVSEVLHYAYIFFNHLVVVCVELPKLKRVND